MTQLIDPARLTRAQLAAVTPQQKIKSLKRELAMRQRVYPRRIESGSMTAEAANQELTVAAALLFQQEELACETVDAVRALHAARDAATLDRVPA